jgi:hypothetical protein
MARLSTGLAEYAAELRVAGTRGLAVARAARDEAGQAIARRGAELQIAVERLERCQQQPDANCSGPAAAVALARRRLEAAQAAQRMIDKATEGFRRAQHDALARVEAAVQEGRGLIARMSGDLEGYLAGGGASRAPSAGAPAALPDGWEMVPLERIDTSGSGVTGAESFGKGYSPADLAWAYDALEHVILPGLANGQGPDDFAARDQAEGRVGTRSYSDTYSGFFADSAIRLEPRADGSFGVANGYHRIWVAQQLGLGAVPGRVR